MQFVTSEDGWTSVVTAAAVDREIDQPAVLNAWAVGNGVAVAVAVGITVGVGDGAGVGVGSGPKVAIGIVGEGMVAIGEGTLVGGMTVCVTAATIVGVAVGGGVGAGSGEGNEVAEGAMVGCAACVAAMEAATVASISGRTVWADCTPQANASGTNKVADKNVHFMMRGVYLSQRIPQKLLVNRIPPAEITIPANRYREKRECGRCVSGNRYYF